MRSDVVFCVTSSKLRRLCLEREKVPPVFTSRDRSTPADLLNLVTAELLKRLLVPVISDEAVTI